MRKTNYPGVYENEQKYYTKNLMPGTALFGESLLKLDTIEYRNIDPTRSKLAAAVKKKIKVTGICEGDTVLYLGASHGYTLSFISDIIGQKGIIFAVDTAYKVFRSLFHVSNERHNVVPIYADAAHPVTYARSICAVDVVYQDVAQKNQVDIFDANFSLYVKDSGIGVLVVKTRCIDAAAAPQKVADEVKKTLRAKGYTLIDAKNLDPDERDHAYIVVSRTEQKEEKKPSRTRTARVEVPHKSGQE